MKLSSHSSRKAPGHVGLGVLLLLFVTATPALASPAVRPPAAQATAQVTAAVPAMQGAPPLFAALLGDRQRMVQVALVFMGVAILILTRGNRF
jgi:hypothetical protein